MKTRATSFVRASSEHKESRDACVVQTTLDGVIGVIADGAGEGEGARWAAKKTADFLVGNFLSRPKEWSHQRSLNEFVRIINRRIYQESMERHQEPRLITTVCVVSIAQGRAVGVYAGDTRAYLVSSGELRCLTRDHTESDQSHVLSRAVGLAPEIEIESFEVDLQVGDFIFICSDGIWNVLVEEKLERLMKAGVSAKTLIDAAVFQVELKKGERDDMSAVAVEILELGSSEIESKSLEWIDPVKGMIVDGYEFISPLESEERIWRAKKEGVDYLLKFPPNAARLGGEEYDRFIREIWNATRLQSIHFVQVVRSENMTGLYLAMEDSRALTLEQFLKQRTLTVEEAILLFKFLLEMGQFLIGNEFAHGDIKLENILILQDLKGVQFKMIDFGNMAEIFTVTGRAGTPSYLAPERFQGAALSERTEVYAMGVTVFKALTGEYPYGEIEPFQNPNFYAAKKPSGLNSNIPLWLESVLLRSVAVEIQVRYACYSEVSYDLTHPNEVPEFKSQTVSFVERNPLMFYKLVFFISLLGHWIWLYLYFSRK